VPAGTSFLKYPAALVGYCLVSRYLDGACEDRLVGKPVEAGTARLPGYFRRRSVAVREQLSRYDLAGRQLSIGYGSGMTVTRGYDAAGRLSSVQDWLANTTTFGYDQDGNLNATSYANAVSAARSYDNADHLTAITYAHAGTTLAQYAYTSTAAGLLNSATPSSGAPGVRQSVTYNNRAQVTSTDRGASTWSYDAANRVTTLGGTALSYDAGDQLSTSTPGAGPATRYTFDASGRRTAAAVTWAGAGTTYTDTCPTTLSTYAYDVGPLPSRGYRHRPQRRVRGDGPTRWAISPCPLALPGSTRTTDWVH
jgi:YD repeat-containing protein